ncbi:MAG: AAA family ATPase [Deltaproteobacteria bacterium]|nr:AAA family ATPase [Deltaproteobacteria bacterium]
MFTFKWLELMNWDYWSHVRMPLDEQVVLIAGPNGSGKTTVLDAVRVLLGARKLSTSRKMPQYLRDDTGVAIVKAVVTNPLRKGTGKRPFSPRGVFDDQATIACVLERKQGQWQRRYHILAGDAPIETLKVAAHGMGPEEYAKALEEAQVPRTLLKVLALEQGETHKLAQRTPEQLLEYVLELQGDKQVLERYAEARSEYLAGQRDLEDMERRLQVQALHVDVLRRDADQYKEVSALESQERQLRDVSLPAARLKGLCRDTDDVRSDLRRADSVLKAADDVLAGFSGEADALRSSVAELRAGIDETKRGYQALMSEKEGLDGKHRDLKRLETELEELRAQGALDVAGEAERLAEERARLVAGESSTRAEVARVIAQIAELRAELGQLEGGGRSRRPPPEATAAMLRELRREGIEAAIVADVIEIVDPEWQVAVESVLGSSRFTILVDAQDELAGRKMGQRQKYRNYVTAWESPRRHAVRQGSALSAVQISDARLPEQIVHQLASVQLVQSVEEGHRLGRQTSITPDGYRQDSRGGIFAGVTDLYCGASSGGHRKAQVESELGRLRQLRDSLEASLAPTSRRIAQIDELLVADKVRGKLLARIGDPEALPGRIAELTDARRAASERLFALLNQIDLANVDVVDRERRISQLEYRNREAILERDRARTQLGAYTAKLQRLEAERSELAATVPAELQTPAAQELLPPELQLIERLNLVRDRIAQFEGNRDPRSVHIHERAAAELAEHERAMARHRNQLAQGNDELALARQAYRRVVQETIRRYRNNVLRLGELCRVEVQVKVPNAEVLRDDNGDLLGKAGLEIRIGFDGKKPVAVDDPKLSGGQSVVSSLILLMALTMEEGGDATGFFILDEPFAHLSVERIDEVARFLGVTRAQFIITTPTTHNLLVYNPARLTLNLRKKPASERHAPVPTFLRR